MGKPTIRLVSADVVPDRLADFDHNAIVYTYEVDGVRVVGIHWSGRYDGSVEHLINWLSLLGKKYRADYITTTESQQKGVYKALQSAFKASWGLQKTGEYVLMYRLGIFRSMPAAQPATRVATAVKNWALWRQMHVAYFNIYHKSLGRRWRILVIHGPSGIEKSPTAPKIGRAWDVAKTGWPKIGASMRRFASVRPNAVQVAVGDANADHHQSYWRHTFNEWLQTKSIWDRKRPDRGTHGRRLIDVAWIWGSK